MRRPLSLALLVILPLTARAQTKPAFSLSAETTAITAPLTPDGLPDYIAALNQKFSKDVTPENNAFAALLQIRGTENNSISPTVHDQFLKMLGLKPTPANTDTWQTYDEYLAAELPADQRPAAADAFASLRNRPWKAEESTRASAYLKKEDKLLDAIVAASKKTRYWSPYLSPDGSMMEFILPALSPMRSMAYGLAARATLRAGSGDFDGFLSDVAAIKRIAVLQSRNGPSLIEQLVAVAIYAVADSALGAVLASGQLSQAHCVKIRDMLAKNELPSPLSLEVERWTQLDAAQRIYAGTFDVLKYADSLGIPKGAFDPFKTIDRDQVDWDAVLKKINGEFDSWDAAEKVTPMLPFLAGFGAAQQKLDGWRKDSLNADNTLKLRPGESRADYSQRIAHSMICLLAPNLWKPEVLRRRALMYDDMLQILLAAADIKAATGQWPKDAAAITAGSALKILPTDIHANPPAPLRYQILPKGIQVYSVGDNNKDDNGIRDLPNAKDDLPLGAPNP
jgi:hypothetical protein